MQKFGYIDDGESREGRTCIGALVAVGITTQEQHLELLSIESPYLRDA